MRPTSSSISRSSRNGGSIATYADLQRLKLPFWPLAFANISIHCLGGDDFSPAAKSIAARELSDALAEGWRSSGKFDRVPLSAIARAHGQMEEGQPDGKAIQDLSPAPTL